MTMQTDELAGQEQDISTEEDQPANSSTTAEESSSAREKELQDRLSRQGRALSELQRTNQALASQLTETNSTVKLLQESMTQQQKDADARRQAENQAYLESLPEDQRVKEELRLSNERLARLEAQVSGRNDRSRTDTSGSPQRQQPPQETPQDYQARRMREIISEAQDEFGVTISRAELESVPEEDWDQERTFHRAIFALAARKHAGTGAPKAEPQGETTVAANKQTPAKETPPTREEIKAEARQEVLRELGVSSAAAPRAAASRRNGPPPSEEEVKASVSAYDSSKGPKGNIARLKELRGRMG